MLCIYIEVPAGYKCNFRNSTIAFVVVDDEEEKQRVVPLLLR
jgi:hypothetical protein